MGMRAYDLSQGRRVPVVWDTRTLINSHILIVGKSGTGKTHTLKKMLSQMASESGGRLRVHVMDVHGDIELESASSVKFSESTPYGFNPLVINPDPDFGGVRKRIQSFIAALNRTGFRLGPKQEAALRNILSDLYAANGFYESDSTSWRLDDGVARRYPKKQPAMEDALRFAHAKLKAMFMGTSSKAVAALDRLNRVQSRMYAKIRRAGQNLSVEEKTKADAEIKALSEECRELFEEHLACVQTGHELEDLIKYDSRDVMKSVVDRLENLNSIGIFRPQRPPFDPTAPIWRYDIRALSTDEKKLFVSFILEAVFLHAAQRGVQDEVREIVVVDEAHMFLTEDPDNPINIIAREARKFGLGMFCASQSPTHFSDDFISNVSTKMLLGLDQMYWDGSVRKLKVEPEALEWVVPHQKMVMQMSNRGDTRNAFLRVVLAD